MISTRTGLQGTSVANFVHESTKNEANNVLPTNENTREIEFHRQRQHYYREVPKEFPT